MSHGPIVLLGGRKPSTNIVYHALAEEFAVARVILEARVPRSRFIRRRMKNLGIGTAVGQVLFQVLALPLLRRKAHDRVEEIKREYNLDDSPIDCSKVVDVDSANSDTVIALLAEIQPAVVVINGTRIIAKRVLTATGAQFVNMHAGITPLYRGVHGGYWALVRNDHANCGVTVHRVDPGIDTGGILAQARIEPTKRDNFATYPLLQAAVGLPLLKKVVRDILEGRAEEQPPPEGESKLWFHPTLWAYLLNRVRKGVR